MFSGEGEQGNHNMEKKFSNRPSSATVKSTPDCKKTDNGNSRFPRQGRKREGFIAPRPKTDTTTYRQSSLQKSKIYDKRPRPRGYMGSGEGQEITQDEAEYGSAIRPGSKKGNWNHLLNFTFAPRESTESGGWGGRGAHWKGRNKWTGKSTIKYNKEQFLQANCQFVVREHGNYLLQATDPDALVDWDLIEQVRIQSQEVPSCPICLYPPTAAKITRCGHIYCWSCILHYLSLGEKTWRKCPICYESVHQKDLKCVVAQESHVYSAGEAISMKLMKRERGSTFTMPVSQWTIRHGMPHNITDEVDTQYTKLLMMTVDQVQQLVADEKAILEIQLQEEGSDTLEGSYVHAALTMLKERERILTSSQSVPANLSLLVDSLSVNGDVEADEPTTPSDTSISPTMKTCGIQYASAFDDELVPEELSEGTSPTEATQNNSSTTEASLNGDSASMEDSAYNTITNESTELESSATEDLEMTASNLTMPGEDNSPRSSANKTTNVYYFYQASNGQHIYLHSLNARCLLKEYGCWENCPETITANIIELEGISMNAELRRRLRYLGHLPLTCEFHVAELALKPPVVSRETLQQFSDEIEKRRRFRQKKNRDEKRRVKKIQDEENRKMGLYPDARLNLGSMNQFPDFSTSDTRGPSPDTLSVTSSTASSTPYGSPPAEESASPSWGSSPADEGGQTSSLSFAQMLRAGKAKPEAWPKVASTPVPAVEKAKSPGSDESDNEDRVPVPTYQHSFGDAIQQALDRYHGDAVTKVEEVPSGGKKKKKPKKQLLFTTSMTRSK